MSLKIGRGRGKKGDGLHIDRETKQRKYGMARNAAMMSRAKLQELLNNANTRAKDIAKIKHLITRRGWNIA